MDSGFGYLKYKLLFVQGEFKTIQHPFQRGCTSCSFESDDARRHCKAGIDRVSTKLGELKMERGLIERWKEKWIRVREKDRM